MQHSRSKIQCSIRCLQHGSRRLHSKLHSSRSSSTNQKSSIKNKNTIHQKMQLFESIHLYRSRMFRNLYMHYPSETMISAKYSVISSHQATPSSINHQGHIHLTHQARQKRTSTQMIHLMKNNMWKVTQAAMPPRNP